MPRFFVDFPCTVGGEAVVAGDDGRHIVKSLRMQAGEKLTLCDGAGTDYSCTFVRADGDQAVVRVLSAAASAGEPSLFVTLYQALPKADKMDSVVQKSVEAGASRIVPVLSSRCVSRPDARAAAKKTERWQKIAEEAAKQCGRGIIPQVGPLTAFEQAVGQAAEAGEIILFYEGGGQRLRELVNENSRNLSIFIGPEGGFADGEVALVRSAGGKTATLGARIFRTETAPVAALSAMMLLSGNM